MLAAIHKYGLYSATRYMRLPAILLCFVHSFSFNFDVISAISASFRIAVLTSFDLCLPFHLIISILNFLVWKRLTLCWANLFPFLKMFLDLSGHAEGNPSLYFGFTLFIFLWCLTKIKTSSTGHTAIIRLSVNTHTALRNSFNSGFWPLSGTNSWQIRAASFRPYRIHFIFIKLFCPWTSLHIHIGKFWKY